MWQGKSKVTVEKGREKDNKRKERRDINKGQERGIENRERKHDGTEVNARFCIPDVHFVVPCAPLH
jgi:hypothetical protein